MHEALRYFIEKVVTFYSVEKFYDDLLQAKEIYFAKAGKATEEDPSFESRMSSFNDWYVLQYKKEGSDRTFVEQYIDSHEVVSDLATAVSSFEHSLYEFCGKSFTGHHVLKDIVANKKIKLAKSHSTPSLVKGDYFLGRTATYGGEVYMFNGMCLLPRAAKSVYKKQAKVVRKAADPAKKEEFLFQTEFLKTKWLSYGHVNVQKIFDYSTL